MLSEIPYISDWNNIGQRRELLVDQNNARKDLKRIDFDYTVGNTELLEKDGIIRKAEDNNIGPYVIMQVHRTSSTRVQQGTLLE